MATATRTFSLEDQPEVFLSTTATSAAIQRAVTAGRARKVAGRLYTRNLGEPLDQVVRRNWQRIAALYFPGAVIVDRSGFEAQPSEDGSLFLDAGPDYVARRPIRLPGLTLRPRRGPGPAPEDMPFMEGLHFSSRGRALLDNMRPSRSRNGSVRRTLSRAELEDELTRTAALRGLDALNELRDQARALSETLGADKQMAALNDLIGAVLGSRDVQLTTDAAKSSRSGLGFDTRRLELFEALQAELLRNPGPARAAQSGSFPALSFIEAYFSNWIEGTEFELQEAEEIVFERAVPEGRFEDAHDVLGTFDLVNDPVKRQQLPDGPDELIDLLRSHHAQMLERRPAAGPGSFKTRSNQAGATVFVHPDMVEGTLVEGYRFLAALPAGLSQAIFMMFLVSEVHPFTDGNGRVGRVLMNSALSAMDQQRIVIPLSYREDYLQGLRALSRNGDPRPLVRILDYAQEYAAAIDWSDLREAERMLDETNAFIPPDVAEKKGLRLLLPSNSTDK
jgi:hypothetical protein